MTAEAINEGYSEIVEVPAEVVVTSSEARQQLDLGVWEGGEREAHIFDQGVIGIVFKGSSEPQLVKDDPTDPNYIKVRSRAVSLRMAAKRALEEESQE